MDDARHIENLIYTYAERLDNGDLEGVASLFREGKIISSAHNSEIAGYDQVFALYRGSAKIYESTGTPLTKHLTTNVIISVDEGALTATARSYYTVIQATDALPLQPIISGRYADSFSKHEGGWQFDCREMFVELIGDCSAHLLYDAVSLRK